MADPMGKGPRGKGRGRKRGKAKMTAPVAGNHSVNRRIKTPIPREPGKSAPRSVGGDAEKARGLGSKTGPSARAMARASDMASFKRSPRVVTDPKLTAMPIGEVKRIGDAVSGAVGTPTRTPVVVSDPKPAGKTGPTLERGMAGKVTSPGFPTPTHPKAKPAPSPRAVSKASSNAAFKRTASPRMRSKSVAPRPRG